MVTTDAGVMKRVVLSPSCGALGVRACARRGLKSRARPYFLDSLCSAFNDREKCSCHETWRARVDSTEDQLQRSTLIRLK